MTHIVLLLAAVMQPAHPPPTVLTASTPTCYVRAGDVEPAIRARLAERASDVCGERGVRGLQIVTVALGDELRAASAVECESARGGER